MRVRRDSTLEFLRAVIPWFALAIFFWMLHKSVQAVHKHTSVLVSCYFLLNVACFCSSFNANNIFALAIFFWMLHIRRCYKSEELKPFKLLLFSFECCQLLTPLLISSVLKGEACYFLLNVASKRHGFTVLWAEMQQVSQGLLFSFEFCSQS